MNVDRARVGVVDIGTNSMRLLITDGTAEIGRWVEVTGLGEGVDATGVLHDDAMERSIDVLRIYGSLLHDNEVQRRAAIATSATRDASNRDAFLQQATEALSVAPRVIDGSEEGRFAYAGAIRGLPAATSWVVSDIGGGSTEFVTHEKTRSVDIGSVRLTDRRLRHRPAPPGEVEDARRHVLELFGEVAETGDSDLVGVAGTWTSLAAIDLDRPAHDRDRVHHHQLARASIDEITGRLAALTVDETAAIPSLDPARAPVILAGAVVAGCVMETLGADAALISERDSLDGVAAELLESS